MSTQPNQPQYLISALNMFPVYKDRASYLAATGHQAPAFKPELPVKRWADPDGPTYAAQGSITYSIFDPKAMALGYVNTMVIPNVLAGLVNLPGAYNYQAPNYPPTDAMQYGPFGPVAPVSADQVCMKADAQTIVDGISHFFPGVTPIIATLETGTYHLVYGQDPRRQWAITFGSYTFLAQTLIEAKNYHGVNSPGHWTWDGKGHIDWVYDPPVIVAPPTAVILPTPIRALLPNEKIIFVPPVNPLAPGNYLVERTDMQAPAASVTTDQRLDAIEATLVSISACIVGIQNQLSK